MEQIYPIIWKYLHLYALTDKAAVYDSNAGPQPNEKAACISKKLFIQPIPNFEVDILIGAKEIFIETEVINNTKNKAELKGELRI